MRLLQRREDVVLIATADLPTHLSRKQDARMLVSHRPTLWASFLLLILSGCNAGTPSGDFQTYDQLLKEESQAPAGQAVVNNDLPDIDKPITPDVASALSDEAVNLATTEKDIPASALAPLNVVDGSNPADILNVVTTSQGNGSVNTNAAPPMPTITVKPGGIQVLVPEQTFKAEGRDQALRVSYDDLDLLKVLNMEPVPDDATKYFPEWLQQLHGKRVRIRGFMYPTFESAGIEQFVLARDNQICCFGRDPKVYDLVSVTLQAGKPTDYIPNRPFDVVGTFHIDLLAEGGKPLGLYWLEDAQVIDR